MPPTRPEPIVIEPSKAEDGSSADSAFIFMHGLGDDGDSFRDLAGQVQASGKLPRTKWVLPTAKENRDAMTRAWYLPSKLSPIPAPRPELEDDEDEDGFLESNDYISSIVDDLVASGIPLNRIALGGFSQGCAMSIFIGLSSKYAGQFAGLVGLMGYMPLPERLEALRKENGSSGDITKQPMFICRGTQDRLVPRRYHRMCLEKLDELKIASVEAHEFEIAHSISGQVIQEMCSFLERIIV